MSFIEKIKSWFAPVANEGAVAASRCFVIDAAGLGRADGKAERLAPGIQIKVLQKLSRFSEKEGISVSAVFEGKELRAVEHGGDFQGVKVYFASRDSDIKDVVMQAAGAAGRGRTVTVITDNTAIERKAQESGRQVMRLSTFRKAVDNGPGESGEGGGGGGGRSQGRSRGGRNRRPPRDGRRGDRPRPQAEREDAPEKSGDPVHDLIDVVE